MEDFRRTVTSFATVEASIKQLNAQVKALREQKEGLTEAIIKYMTDNNIESCNLPDESRLVLKSQIQLGALNKEYMYETLVDFYKEPQPNDAKQLAEKTTDTLLGNRDVKEKKVIKILKKK